MYIPAWPSLNPLVFLQGRLEALPPFPIAAPAKTYFYVARSGIYHLMRELGRRHRGAVLAPDYHHGNEIYAMKAAGVKISYYPVKTNLDADLDALEELCAKIRPAVLYVTHFIGWPQPMNEICALCRKFEMTLVEDCALCFMSTYEGKPLGAFGGHSIFCLYKSLPLPNGGVLVRNTGEPGAAVSLLPSSALSIASRSAELMLQWFTSRCETGGRALFALKRAAGRALSHQNLRRVPLGDTGFDVANVNIGMSPVCHTLLRRLRYDSIREMRRRNFRILHEGLNGAVQLLDRALTDDVCPLFFPLLVKDKQTAAQALWQRGIETVQFWNHGDPEICGNRTDAGFLRRHLLEVPIHQDVTPDAAAYTADQILKLGIGIPAC